MKNSPIVFFFVSLFSFGQHSLLEQKTVDSILRLLNEKRDSLKLEAFSNPVMLSKDIDHDSLLRESSIQYASYSKYNKDIGGIIVASENLRRIYKKSTDSIAPAKYFELKTIQFRRQFKQESAYYYFNVSKEVSAALQDYVEVGRRLLSMAYIQKDEKDYVGAEATAVQALEFLAPVTSYKKDMRWRSKCIIMIPSY